MTNKIQKRSVIITLFPYVIQTYYNKPNAKKIKNK